MNLKTGICMVVVSVACLCLTESKSNAQVFQRGGGQLVSRAARAYAVRAIPGGGIARFAIQRGVRNTGFGQGFIGGTQQFGNQGFGAQRFGNQGFGNQGFGNQGFGNQFGVRNGLQAVRLFRRF